MMDRFSAEQAVLSRGWLAAQAPHIQSAILRRANLLPVAGRTVIMKSGDPPGGLYGIVAGCIGTYLPSPWGAEDLTHLQHPGDWFGPGSAVARGPRVMGYRSLEPSVLLHVPLPAALALFESDPDIAHALGQLGWIALRTTMLTVSNLMIQRVDRRVAAVLLRISGAQYGRRLTPTDDIRLTQTDLAAMANASRGTVNPILLQFQGAGWIRLGYNRIAITQPERLAAFAFDCDPGAEPDGNWPELPGEGLVTRARANGVGAAAEEP